MPTSKRENWIMLQLMEPMELAWPTKQSNRKRFTVIYMHSGAMHLDLDVACLTTVITRSYQSASLTKLDSNSLNCRLSIFTSLRPGTGYSVLDGISLFSCLGKLGVKVCKAFLRPQKSLKCLKETPALRSEEG
jgi:hypothetical protein